MRKKRLYVVIGLVAVAAVWYGIGCGLDSDRAAQRNAVVDLKDGDTYTLRAAYIVKQLGGKEQTMLAYNNSIPGPTIRVPQGAEITLNFRNDTDLPTLLHSHGVRMDNAFDGSQLQQEEIKPGGSFTYKLKFQDAGVYWYHPHANEVFGQGLGLYGAFIVTPSVPEYFPPVNREVPLFLSDIPVEGGMILLSRDEPSHSLMGHYGNIMLVNGEENYTLEASQGEVIRLYLINAANTRPFNFAIKDAQVKLIGGDSGAYERASLVQSIVLAPSERAIVDVFLPRIGKYEIQNRTPDKTYALGEIIVSGRPPRVSYEAEFNVLQESLAASQSIDSFRSLVDKAPDKRILLTLDMGAEMLSMPGMGHGAHMMEGGQMMGGSMTSVSPDGIEWEDENKMMNQMSSPESIKWKLVDQDTGKENLDIGWSFKRGNAVKIRIFNDPKSMHPMQHPIHFHGQRFLVAARNGVAENNLVWKDTVLVKSGETVDIILDPSNPGEWMAHCHISEHLEAGMMLKFKVE